MFINYTPFPGIAYDNFDVKRRLTTTTIIRGRFRLHTTTTEDLLILRPDPEQGGLEAKDRYYDNDLNQPVQRESDYAPYKPATDIIFNGHAHSGNQQPRPHWRCGIRVENDQGILLEKQLSVSGESQWEKHRQGWQLSEPQLTTRVHLYPGNTYGGRIVRDDPETPAKTFAANPHGKGWPPPGDKPGPHPAPQILTPATTLTTPEEEQVPAHFSWIPRTAPQRQQKAGSMDESWLNHGHPFLPKDFDDAYHQGAADDQQISPHLKGNEIITLGLLLPNIAWRRIQLPDYQLFYQYRFDDQDDILGRLLLDTVFINLEDPDPKAWRIDLTWRSRTPAATGSTKTEALLIVPPDHRAEADSTKTTRKAPLKESPHGG